MKKKKRIPTILGLLILTVGIGFGVFLVRKEQIFSPRADIKTAPNQVRISNVTDNSFTISWITQEGTFGYVLWGPKGSSLNNVAKDETETSTIEKKKIHYVQVSGLSPSTAYIFKLASDSQNNLYDNHGQPYELTTGSNLGSLPPPDTIFGTILNQQGAPAKDALVYFTLANAQPISTQVKSNGNWVISLSTIRTEALDDWIRYDIENTMLDLSIQGDLPGMTSIVTTTGCARPVPTITMGKTYDFRDLCESGDETTDQTEEEQSSDNEASDLEGSGFASDGLEDAQPASPSGEVTIDNPSRDNEELATTKPEFHGSTTDTNKVPVGTVITIKVQSPQAYTGTATIENDGGWSWTLPEDVELDPGEHTITISYINNNGDEKTVNRTFIVAAAGDTGLPAFEASPSAETTPSATLTPTLTATPTAAPRTSMPSTESGVPEAGYLTPTFLLSILGIGLFIAGFTVLRF